MGGAVTQRELGVVISGGTLTWLNDCRQFVELVARLRTRTEARSKDYAGGDPAFGLYVESALCIGGDDALDRYYIHLLDTMIERARELTRQGQV